MSFRHRKLLTNWNPVVSVDIFNKLQLTKQIQAILTNENTLFSVDIYIQVLLSVLGTEQRGGHVIRRLQQEVQKQANKVGYLLFYPQLSQGD